MNEKGYIIHGVQTGRSITNPRGVVIARHEVDASYRWKDRRHNKHAPQDMETRHLFMTVVMIWNHTLPREHIIAKSGAWRHHQYNLGPYYTPSYLKQSIRELVVELLKRDDILPEWQATLDRMVAILVTGQIPHRADLHG